MNTINSCKGDDDMMEDRIVKIEKDIQSYEEAITNAECAIAQAERELTDEINHRIETGEVKLED